ncbi:MAG: deoxyribodipyrimidine photo-lyase [Spirochaetales bacterium]
MEPRKKALFTFRSTEGEYVLYWMQASVRVRANLALVEAAAQARSLGCPLAVVFCLTAFPEANARSFAFLLDGLQDVAASLDDLGVSFTVVRGEPIDVVPLCGRLARLVVFDRGYLPIQRRWRERVAAALPCPVLEVEDNVAVPVETVSTKSEWSAATLRPKLMRLAELETLSEPVWSPVAAPSHLKERWKLAGVEVLDAVPSRQDLARFGNQAGHVPATELPGGERAAWRAWTTFAQTRLERYDSDRNDPNLDATSGLAPYLHFGHITPLTILAELKSNGLWKPALSYRRSGEDPVSKFLDELLVRRELAVNAAWYNPEFASFAGLPQWARRTLANHALDRREFLYTPEQWEAALTHDPAWNAAQTELVTTGRLHGTLRMYWGKKLLEWSADPAEAFDLALRLNNKYALDGRDPNSAAGVAWCFGAHDRPWGERPVYGLVRCMTSGGLARKFDLAAYLRRFTRPSSPPPLQRSLPL